MIDYLVASELPFAGTLPFDVAGRRAVAARRVDRTANLAASLTNHVVADGGPRWRERLGEITAPTLVVHGTEDPLFPFGNALALAREIRGARLLPLERVGHEMPPRQVWGLVVPAIMEHTASDRPR